MMHMPQQNYLNTLQHNVSQMTSGSAVLGATSGGFGGSASATLTPVPMSPTGQPQVFK